MINSHKPIIEQRIIQESITNGSVDRLLERLRNRLAEVAKEPRYTDKELDSEDWISRITTIICEISEDDIWVDNLPLASSHIETQIDLSYGSKVLKLIHRDREGGEEGLVSNLGTSIDTTSATRQPMETTVLYAASRVLMQIIVNELRKDLEYCLVSETPELFDWIDNVAPLIFEDGVLIANNDVHELSSTIKTDHS